MVPQLVNLLFYRLCGLGRWIFHAFRFRRFGFALTFLVIGINRKTFGTFRLFRTLSSPTDFTQNVATTLDTLPDLWKVRVGTDSTLMDVTKSQWAN